MNDVDTLIGPALRERMRSEQPDLEHLAAMSLRAGVRLRRRRQVATVAGGAAAVAVVGVAAGQVGGGATARDPDVATSSSAEPSPTATVTADTGASVTAPAGEPTLPVTLDARGWTCESFPIDQKMWCTKGGTDGISVVVRDGAEHDAWAGDRDKAGSAMWTSPVHGNYFVSIQGGPGSLPAAELQAVIDGLTFADSWQRP